jgi:hypothetical protein
VYNGHIPLEVKDSFMNIDDLTIRQAKELANLFGGASGSLQASFVGKYVICRSRSEGLNAGVVVAADKTGVVLKDCRRLWYHKPLREGACWYEAIANSGLSNTTGSPALYPHRMSVGMKVAAARSPTPECF